MAEKLTDPLVQHLYNENLRCFFNRRDDDHTIPKLHKVFNNLSLYGPHNHNLEFTWSQPMGYMEVLRQKFPGVANTEPSNITKLIHELRNAHTTTDFIGPQSDLITIVAFPEFSHLYRFESSVPFIYHVIKHGGAKFLFKPEDRDDICGAISKVVDYFENNEIGATRRIVDIHVTALLRAHQIGRKLNKPLDWEYYNPAMKAGNTVLSLGLTHVDVIRASMRDSTNADEFISHIKLPQRKLFVENWDEFAHSSDYFSISKMPGLGQYLSESIHTSFTHMWGLLLNDNKACLEWTKQSSTYMWDARLPAGHPIFKSLTVAVNKTTHFTKQGFDIFSWVLKHRTWYDSYSNVGEGDDQVQLHHHTLVEMLFRLVGYAYMNPGYAGLLERLPKESFTISSTPTEFMEYWGEVVNLLKLELLRDRRIFPETKVVMETIPFEGGDIVFKRLKNSVELKIEGTAMKHCIGGYGDVMERPNHLAYHVTYGEQERCTVYIAYSVHAKAWILEEISGYRNETVPNDVRKLIEVQVAKLPGPVGDDCVTK